MKYIIANWKAQKNYLEAQKWIETFITFPTLPNVEIVIAPSYPYIPYIYEKIKNSSIHLASQDISSLKEGAHTGEVPAAMLQDVVQYAIIGHSERRNELKENQSILDRKMERLGETTIQPIFCIRGIRDVIPDSTTIIAYEPDDAISTGSVGKNEDIQTVLHVKKSLSLQNKKFIYGGSVTVENASIYLNHPEIDGVLVGSDCLNATRFYEIAKQVV